MSATVKRRFWQAPSGRLHGHRSCSGGTARLNKAKSLTPDQWREHANKCRCATWSAISTTTAQSGDTPA